jgi:hypothetical protein
MNTTMTRVVTAAASAAALVAVPATASAEGGFYAGFSGIPGTESSRWTDQNLDSVSGYAQFTLCSPTPTVTVLISVYKDIVGVDPVIKADRPTCDAQVSIGDVASGRYYVRYRQGPAPISARLTVRY